MYSEERRRLVTDPAFESAYSARDDLDGCCRQRAVSTQQVVRQHTQQYMSIAVLTVSVVDITIPLSEPDAIRMLPIVEFIPDKPPMDCEEYHKAMEYVVGE